MCATTQRTQGCKQNDKCRYLPAAVGTFGPGQTEILYPGFLFGSSLIFDTEPDMANLGSTVSFKQNIVRHV